MPAAVAMSVRYLVGATWFGRRDYHVDNKFRVAIVVTNVHPRNSRRLCGARVMGGQQNFSCSRYAGTVPLMWGQVRRGDRKGDLT